MKAVPGRKTDVKDAEWIADLFQHGLLKGSFMPPRRTGAAGADPLSQHSGPGASPHVNRLQKILEDANIKLGGVATDVTGVSGRAILNALCRDRPIPALAELAKGQLRRRRHWSER